jgi:transcriptional regulator with PAS, ATPase and Fis domain
LAGDGHFDHPPRRSRADIVFEMTDDARATESLPAEERASVQGFTLRVVSGPDAGATFTAADDRVVVGTHQSAAFVLTDGAVSRFHFEIATSESSATLRDLGSLNGTSVEGVSVLHARLRDGETITVGRTQIRFELAQQRPQVVLSTRGRFGLAVGRSYAMARTFAVLERAAKTDATVLIEGETGTGKELVAESIHREGERKDGPFVVVDCASIPHALLESELFGHTRGAFTGAVAAREGALEAASGGTLFLDEIGELDPELQPKLLRAIERREIKRVGETAFTKIDVRVVAATNQSLSALVNEKRFRADLYYRLAVVEVRLPPLRERREDIPILVEHLLASLGAALKPEAHALRTPESLAELARHAWPGNVRELRNYVERCVTLSERAPLASSAQDALADDDDTSVPLKRARERWVASLERRYLERIIAEHQGNVTAAARAAGVDRVHMYRLLWRYGMR